VNSKISYCGYNNQHAHIYLFRHIYIVLCALTQLIVKTHPLLQDDKRHSYSSPCICWWVEGDLMGSD